MPEFRKDPVIGRWIIIATERASRPSDFPHAPQFNDDASKCPFCEGHENITPSEIIAYHPPGREKNTKGWWVRVVPNKYPALLIGGDMGREGEGMYDKMNGVGAHEVVVETPEHRKHWADMEVKQLEDVLWAFKDRMTDLKKDRRFKYILVFKNYGKSAGASLSHPHSQIIAMPMVPIRVAQEIEGAQRHYNYKDRCVFCDMVKEEMRFGKRVVGNSDGFIAIEPYASRFPFETWILPKTHRGHFDSITGDEAHELAIILKQVMGKLRDVLEDPALNVLIHTTPVQDPESPYYHWHIEIMPKLTHVAGFEWGTGCYINPVSPERAAELLNLRAAGVTTGKESK